MRAWSFVRHCAGAVVIGIVAPAVAAGQAVPAGEPLTCASLSILATRPGLASAD